MFYFITGPYLIYRWFLILSAIIPAIFLMIKVYCSDRLERERPSFLGKLAVSGILSALIALVCERIGCFILDLLVPQTSQLYNLLLYFVIVAVSEEGAKFFMLRRNSWNSPQFNCQYDAVVYATFVSLGFALWENISYVLHYGFTTALVRAVTAIPGHTCFGVFMGLFYGFARAYAYIGDEKKSKFYRVLSVLVPVLIHGAYDYIASMGSSETESISSEIYFFVFIAVLFVASFLLVRKISSNDRYITLDRQGELPKY